ncbi:PTS transporter subunit IIC [uncultured Parolsenella sp.]|uniref:PTS transporter subunit IIC n=1 Tax=uncultured Parolsenella sp. TaxID=2083008 RepID=UPI0027DCA861|nr:PTS transporter subunit IIC [uncultured Parolsenella sp.]
MRPTPTRSAARAPLPTDCAESPGRAGPRARRERSRRHPPPGRRAQKSNKDKGRKWYLGVNPAVGVGETATLTTGLLCIPLLLAVAFTLPGNQVLPMVDLITLPSMSIVFACTSNGNILKSTIMAIVWFTLGLFV